MSDWAVEEFRALRLEEIDVRYARYRLSVLEAEETMARSLRRYGQISPVVVCLREEMPVLVDGFKRLAAARGLKGFGTLSARRIEVDERSAKAAMYGLNRIGAALRRVGGGVDGAGLGAGGRAVAGRGGGAAGSGTRVGSVGGWR